DVDARPRRAVAVAARMRFFSFLHESVLSCSYNNTLDAARTASPWSARRSYP
uniref:Uncharacterized protein n=1 Tax=Oryza brachyantha TaxID=4533 RepID=J3MMI6_ORYBR